MTKPAPWRPDGYTTAPLVVTHAFKQGVKKKNSKRKVPLHRQDALDHLQ